MTRKPGDLPCTPPFVLGRGSPSAPSDVCLLLGLITSPASLLLLPDQEELNAGTVEIFW